MIKEIFRSGVWTSSEGNQKTYTDKDLDNIISQFDESNSKTLAGRRVPLTIGHPSDNAPAFGWLKRVWREGNKLMGEFNDMVDIMKTWIKQKSYREVSIALNGDLSLRHVGILGGVPPAVPNMADWKFDDGKDYVELYSDDKDVNFKKGESMELEEALKKVAKLEVEGEKIKSEFEAVKEKNIELESRIAESEKELESAKNQFSEKEKAFNELVESNKISEEKRLDEADFSFVEGLIKEGKIAPVNKQITLINLKAHRNSEELSFTDGEGKEVKKTPLQMYKESLEDSKVLIKCGESFTDGKDKNDVSESKLEKLTKEYSDKFKLSYSQASAKVLQEYPELNKEGE